MELIKSISGIRGIYNHTFNVDDAIYYLKSFISIQPEGTILIARDTRLHGKIIYDSMKDYLKNIGKNVLSCNIIPTPTAQFIIKERELSGGIVITASHNPEEWNGLKFIDNDGCYFNSHKMKKLLSGNTKGTKIEQGKIIELYNAHETHISNVLNLNCIDADRIKKMNFKVVVDTVNGAAYKALPELLENFNCNVIKIHCNNNGKFPRGTEPIPCHLNDLSTAVVKNHADIGLATDPDADRLAIVDNNGNPIGEESTLILALESYLKYYKNSQKIVTNLSTSMGVDIIAKKYSSSVKRTSVGEINVVEKMKEINSSIGGEGNGGVILDESHLGRDSLVASALVLNYLAKSNKTLSQIMKNLPSHKMIKTKIDLDTNINLSKIKNQFSSQNDVKFIESDGLKILWENKWVHIRKSNTEPIIRIISEAKNKETAEDLIDSIKNILN